MIVSFSLNHPEMPKRKPTKKRAHKESPKSPCAKAIPLGNIICVSGSASAPITQSLNLATLVATLVIKARHMWFKDFQNNYVKNFLIKPIEVEYYVDTAAETNVKFNFHQPFDNHGLLNLLE